jgi:tetratricopeptide (TPR) repeat protein
MLTAVWISRVVLAVAFAGTAEPAVVDAELCPTGAGPEALVAAARCLVDVGAWSAAAAAYERVAAESPAHPLAEQALVALAEGHAATANFVGAADAAERLAERYPGHAEAPGLLVRAAWWRVGLGQRALADADFERHEKLYGREDPRGVAAVFLSRIELLDTDAAREAHLAEYLRRHGKVVAPALRLLAEARLGQLEWRRSCDKGKVADACMRINRTQPVTAHTSRWGQRFCGPYMTVFTVYLRDERLAAAAQRRLAAVLRAAGTAPAELPEHAAARAEARAIARLAVADRELEQLLDSGPREALALTLVVSSLGQVRYEDPRRRLAKYREQTRERVGSLEQAYAELARLGPAWAVAAASRTGWMHEHFAAQLTRAAIPTVGGGGSYDLLVAYCASFAELAAPHVAAARAATGRCRELSREAGIWGVFSEACERVFSKVSEGGSGTEVHRHDPEFVGAPTYTKSRPETIGLQPSAVWSGAPSVPR